MPALVLFVGLFVASGLVIGWRTAYDVMVGITSPATTNHVLAWVLSVAGWLIGPAVAGAVVGYMITKAIDERRKRPVSNLFTQAGDVRDPSS